MDAQNTIALLPEGEEITASSDTVTFSPFCLQAGYCQGA